MPRNSFEKLISDEALGIAVTDYAPYVGEPMHELMFVASQLDVLRSALTGDGLVCYGTLAVCLWLNVLRD